MSTTEALSGIVSLVGAGGVTSIVLGFLAYKGQARAGRRAPLESADLVDANGMFPGSHDVELLTNAVTGLTAAFLKWCVLQEFQICQQHSDAEAFREFIAKREMEETLAAFKAQQKAQHPPR
jgi:hypothetical protein